MRVFRDGSRTVIAAGNTQVWIDPWGADSFRVRMTAQPKMDENDWALGEKMPEITPEYRKETVDVTDPWYKSEEYAQYHQTADEHFITNGKLTVSERRERGAHRGILAQPQPHKPLLRAASR